MEANEIRCNSYYLNQDGEVEMFEFRPIQIDYMDNWQPIPLTPEWLEKFGFKGDYHVEKYYENEVGYKITPNTASYDFHYPSLHCGDIEITYVHQLQNLYFALTGEELEIKALHISGE